MTKYYFGRCELDTIRHELLVAGIVRHVEPQVFDLLRFFVERGDSLVSQADLIEHIWKGRVVSDSAISVRINAARKAVGDNGTKQAIIKTLPRRGYRLVAKPDCLESTSESKVGSGQKQFGFEDAGLNYDNRPVLAIFQFECVGDEQPPAYLTRGIVDDIATELSRFHTMEVISTYSTFKHDISKGGTNSFAASINATHAVTGSIQISDSRIRLTVRLGDVSTGKSVWSERYDIDFKEVFEAQDDAVYKIVSNLFSRLNEHQMSIARQKPTSNLNAYDCVLRGLKIYKSGEISREETEQAVFWFDRALEMDSGYARGIAWRECAYSNFWSNPPTTAELEKSAGNMSLALSIDETDHEVHRLKGALHVIRGEFELGDYHLAKSVELNPNDAHILLRIGYYRSFLGDKLNDLTYVDLAFLRNPLHPDWYWHDRGVVLFAHGDYQQALNSLRRYQTNSEANYIYQAACLAALGEKRESVATLDQLRNIKNDINLDWVKVAYPYRCYQDGESTKCLAELLSIAGLR